MIVAGTNLIAHLVIRGQRTKEAMAILRRDPSWAVPLLWRSELRSVLALHLRQRLLGWDQALTIMNEAERFLTAGEIEASSEDVLRLASSSKCSAYDCEFVAVAKMLRVPLVTSDKEILSAFPEAALTPEEFLA